MRRHSVLANRFYSHDKDLLDPVNQIVRGRYLSHFSNTVDDAKAKGISILTIITPRLATVISTIAFGSRFARITVI